MRRPENSVGALTAVLITVAGFSIWQFSDGFLLALETLVEPQRRVQHALRVV
jgi:hypothetical protein